MSDIGVILVDIPGKMRYSMGDLYWDASYEIVLSLMEAHPDVVVDDVGLDQLYRWVVDLPDFADDPLLANDEILTGILRDWYEEVNP